MISKILRNVLCSVPILNIYFWISCMHIYVSSFLVFAGYDSMGFEMSKPHLRSELEADLQR